MTHATTRDLHIRVFHGRARGFKFVNGDQLARIAHAFIRDARVNVELLILEEVMSHLCQTRRTVDIDLDWL